MQVEGVGSKILNNSDRTRRNQDGRRKGKRCIRLTNSTRN